MKFNLRWISLIVFAVVIVRAFWFLPGRGVNTPAVRTLQLMQNIFIDIDLLSDSDRILFAQSVQGLTETMELNRACAAFLQRCMDPDITNSARFISPNGIFCDAWGTPFWFAKTNTSIYKKSNLELRENNVDLFVIWSSGENRTNDFGFGDDLALHRSTSASH